MKAKNFFLLVAGLGVSFGCTTLHSSSEYDNGSLRYSVSVDSLSRNAVSNTIAQFERDFRAGKQGEILLQAISENSVLRLYSQMTDSDKFQYCVNKKVSEVSLDINGGNPEAYNQIQALTEATNQEFHAYIMAQVIMEKIVQAYNDIRWNFFVSDADSREEAIKKAHAYLLSEYTSFRNQGHGLITQSKKRAVAIALRNELARRYAIFNNAFLDYSNNPN